MKQTMKSCILEQADTLRNVINNGCEASSITLSELGCKTYERVIMVGSGTSLNAAILGKYAFETFNDIDVHIVTPFDFINYFPHKRLNDKTLLIGISQTARSSGTIKAINIARRFGVKTIMVTAEINAEGARCADSTLYSWTGEELIGAKTKGFTSTMAMLYCFASTLAGKCLKLEYLPNFMNDVLVRTENNIHEAIDEFFNAKSITIIGGGPGMAAAKEGGLKILETVRVPVEVYDVEEYMHGPYHCLEEDTYLIFLAIPGSGQNRMIKMIEFAQQITSHVLVVGNESLKENVNIRNLFIGLPDSVDEILAPIGYVVPLQWLANDITLKKGRIPGQSRYPDFHAILGSKSMPKVNYYL